MEIGDLPDEEVIAPEGEIEQKDHLAGDLNNDTQLQRIYTLGRKLSESGARMLLEAHLARKHDQQEELLIKASELRAKAEIVMSIFWISIKDSFQLWDKPSVGIRQEWQVVWSDQDISIPPFFRNLLDL